MSRPAATILAFDASTEMLAIAVQGPVGQRRWVGPGGPLASTTLLPRARAMLTDLGLAWRDLEAIAFGAGPGAFTGLRTACAVAQGLAYGAGCNVLPIDSLAIVAEDAGVDIGLPLWVAMDARMNEVYAAEYRHDGQEWQAQRDPALYTLPALAALWTTSPPTQLAGSALAAFTERLPVGIARCVPQEIDRAAALLRLARLRHATGAGVDPALALPVYLRDKVALTVTERQALRAAALARA